MKTSALKLEPPTVEFKDPNDAISYGLASDSHGNLYYTDLANHLIQKLHVDNGHYVLSTIGGTKGLPGYDTTGLKYNNPHGIALDGAGNIYVCDTDNHIVRKLTAVLNSPGHYITSTIAGTPSQAGFSGDNDLATKALLNTPQDIAVDDFGNIYISDAGNQVIRVIWSSNNQITTIAGTQGKNGYFGDDTLATTTPLNSPTGLSVDKSGVVYLADQVNNRIRKLTPQNPPPPAPPLPPLCVKRGTCDYVISTIAGNGQSGNSGNGGSAVLAAISEPVGIALDGYNNVFISSPNTKSIRKVDHKTQTINMVSSNVNVGAIATAPDHNLWVLNNATHIISRITSSVITSLGTSFTDPNKAISYSMAIDGKGNIYYTDTENHLVQKVVVTDGDYSLITIGGTIGKAGYQSTGAKYNNPHGIAVDVKGNVYVADTNNHVIRKLSANLNGSGYTITVLAGTPEQSGYSGDGESADKALLDSPQGVDVDDYGNVYIADTNNQVIRVVWAWDGSITTIAGMHGKNGYLGDNISGLTTELNNPTNVRIDKSGNIYVTDQTNNRVRKLTPQAKSTYWCEKDWCAKANGEDDSACMVKHNKSSCVYGTLSANAAYDPMIEELSGMEQCIKNLRDLCKITRFKFDKDKSITEAACDEGFKCVQSVEIPPES